jgi:hypothetical protein
MAQPFTAMTQFDPAKEVHPEAEPHLDDSPSGRPLVTTMTEDKAYSAFTQRGKWTIVTLVSFASFFRQVRYIWRVVHLAYQCHHSPLTANIYFPAIPTIAQAFHKSTELINLTVTM